MGLLLLGCSTVVAGDVFLGLYQLFQVWFSCCPRLLWGWKCLSYAWNSHCYVRSAPSSGVVLPCCFAVLYLGWVELLPLVLGSAALSPVGSAVSGPQPIWALVQVSLNLSDCRSIAYGRLECRICPDFSCYCCLV